MQSRLRVSFKLRRFENGKELDRRYLKNYNECFPLLPVGKGK
jgi:hypothetical protein